MTHQPAPPPASGRAFTPGPVFYSCGRCGWTGFVASRRRCLPCSAASVARWRREYPVAARELKRRMEKTEAGRARVTRHKRERRARNPETAQAAWQRRVDWLASGDVTRDQLLEIFQATHGRCTYCAQLVDTVRLNPHDPRGFDHVVPRAKGGAHTASNIVLCCGPCNERKTDGLAA